MDVPIIGTQLLASSLKGDERITVQVNGDGPGGKSWPMRMVGEMRGYITNPHVSLELNDKGKLDVRGSLEQTEQLRSSKT